MHENEDFSGSFPHSALVGSTVDTCMASVHVVTVSVWQQRQVRTVQTVQLVSWTKVLACPLLCRTLFTRHAWLDSGYMFCVAAALVVDNGDICMARLPVTMPFALCSLLLSSGPRSSASLWVWTEGQFCSGGRPCDHAACVQLFALTDEVRVDFLGPCAWAGPRGSCPQGDDPRN